MIPKNVAVVVVVRNAQRSVDTLGAFLQTLDQDMRPLTVADIQRRLGLEPDVWDRSKPVVLIVTRPDAPKTMSVVAFTPRDPASFRKLVGGRDNVVRRCERSRGACNLMMRDGVVFMGEKRKAVRMMRNVSRERSLAASLDPTQRAQYADGDVFLYASMDRWRERIAPSVLLLTRLIKLGAAAQQEGTMVQGAEVMIAFMADGLWDIVDQLETLSLSIAFDGETFRLIHHQRFKPGRSVSEFLRRPKRHGGDLWEGLPNHPFFLAVTVDWSSPSGVNLAARFNRQVLEIESVAARIPPQTRERILEATAACFDQVQGTRFVLSAPEGRLLPMRVFGAYRMKDSRKGIAFFRFIRECCGRAKVMLLPSEGYPGELERRRHGDLEYDQVSYDVDEMPPIMRRQMTSLYGRNVRYQQARAGDHLLVYSVSSPPAGVVELVRAVERGDNLGRNPDVRRALGRLPPEPHIVVVVDAGRALASIPYMLEAGRLAREGPEAAVYPPEADYAAPPGPMVAWAGFVHRDAFSGYLAVDARDAVKLVKLAREMVEDMQERVQADAWGRKARSSPKPRTTP